VIQHHLSDAVGVGAWPGQEFQYALLEALRCVSIPSCMWTLSWLRQLPSARVPRCLFSVDWSWFWPQIWGFLRAGVAPLGAHPPCPLQGQSQW